MENIWHIASKEMPTADGSYYVKGKWESGKLAEGEVDFQVNDGYFDVPWNFEVLQWRNK